jgi:hypothetical protein
MRRLISFLLPTALAGLLVSSASSDPPRKNCDAAGIRGWAVPSDTGHYVGYYVGGGCAKPRRAEPPYPDEGTWGWDYRGWLVPRNVILGWWHGRRAQGGTGAYKTDGPKILQQHQEEGH